MHYRHVTRAQPQMAESPWHFRLGLSAGKRLVVAGLVLASWIGTGSASATADEHGTAESDALRQTAVAAGVDDVLLRCTAATAEDPVAYLRVGKAYAQGIRVAQYPAQAREWFTKAISAFRRLAYLGHPRVRYALSASFDKQVIRQHIHWLRLASGKGSVIGYAHMAEA